MSSEFVLVVDAGTVYGVAIFLAFVISVIANLGNDRFKIPAIFFGVASFTSLLPAVMCGSITKFLIIGSLGSLLSVGSHHSPLERNGRDDFHMAGYYSVLLSLAALMVNILIWIFILADVSANFGDYFGDWWIGRSAEFYEISPEAMLATEISKIASAILCPIGMLLLFLSDSFHSKPTQLT